MNPLLMMTATIDPGGMSHVHQVDPESRRAQYREALQFWLGRPDQELAKIVFVENSGADLSDFESLKASRHHGKELEIISLRQNSYARHLGKGYGEFRMLDEAVRNSALLKECDSFAKVTGRLIVKNWGKIVFALPKKYDLVCDTFVKPASRAGGLVDSRLVFFSAEFYRSFVVNLFERMNDSAGVYAEHAIFELMRERANDKAWSGSMITRLPREPKWQGCSGSTGQSYSDWRAEFKRPFKVLRRMRDRITGYPSLQELRAI